ncbi:unnamed protein product [Didymodactylos carnosus]|uniref:Uncharacterized protein n=1 Tax=Didymodactylos carnosus TaxID=1234261 RepID=A0A814LW18_9BILA|nr:unnamed protein product [Didymodactylos carnosus]CAF3837660.1 unnamed protein product [Didymodactylos carnosus]
MNRITVMLKALTVPGSPAQNDTTLLSSVHCALNVWLIHDWQNPNWWWNQIGIPLQATSQLLMLGDNATDFEISMIKNMSYRADWWYHDPGTGANLVWMLQIELYRSLATDNRTGVEQGFTRMWKDIAVLPLGGQGIQSDWSYHFHGQQILSASYGQDWAIAIIIFVICSDQTQYEIDKQQLSIFATFLTEGDAWMSMGEVWDWSVLGRDIDRPNTEQLVAIKPDWLRTLSKLSELNNSRELLNWADRLDALSDATPLVGNRHYYTSDYHVHRRANWTSTIKMQSIRTTPAECINAENQKAEHVGQGVLNLYATDAQIGRSSEYIQIFPLLDWQAINGITVEHDIPIEPCKNGRFDLIKLSFVGGVSDGNYGVAMMDTASHNLTTKRSWHFYDDAIIALASDITLSTDNIAWTTLASRILPDPNSSVTVGFFNTSIITLSDGNYSFPYSSDRASNVQWFHAGGVGYVLQTQEQYFALGLEVGRKTGNYNTFGPYNFTITARMLTVWLNHGLGPYILAYRYVMLPNVTASEIPHLVNRYVEAQVFSCISSSKNLHASIWPTLQRASFVLFENSTSHSYSCQSPSFQVTAQLSDSGAYLFSETDTDFSISASHPTRVNGNVSLIVDRAGDGEGCMRSAGSTIVTLALPTSPQLLGASVTVTCRKG